MHTVITRGYLIGPRGRSILLDLETRTYKRGKPHRAERCAG